MPITKSAKKALRQSVRRHAQNLKRKEGYKKIIKEIKNLANESKKAEAKAMLPKLYKALDKAAKSNTIKKNKASRLKSRTAKFLSEKK